MSLDYQLDKIENFRDVCFSYKQHKEGSVEFETRGRQIKPVTESLIFATMSTGMGDITTENAPEFWARVNLCQKYIGPWFYDANGPVEITAADVVAHIGLHSNVKTLTRRQWINGFLSESMNDDVANCLKLAASMEPMCVCVGEDHNDANLECPVNQA